MKHAVKIMSLVLILALTIWAQTATQTPAPDNAQRAPAAQSETKAGCPCCQKSADGKHAEGCCREKAKSDTAMACCHGAKDAKACMRSDKCKGNCADGKCCNGSAEKACCTECSKKASVAKACCKHGEVQVAD